MSKTLKERYVAALVARGSTLVKRNHKHDVYTRLNGGGFYYVGVAGSLRAGRTVASSIPVSASFKKALLAENEAHLRENMGLTKATRDPDGVPS